MLSVHKVDTIFLEELLKHKGQDTTIDNLIDAIEEGINSNLKDMVLKTYYKNMSNITTNEELIIAFLFRTTWLMRSYTEEVLHLWYRKHLDRHSEDGQMVELRLPYATPVEGVNWVAVPSDLGDADTLDSHIELIASNGTVVIKTYNITKQVDITDVLFWDDNYFEDLTRMHNNNNALNWG